MNVTEKKKKKLRKGRKHSKKSRKCWKPALSPFSTTFSKRFGFRVIKSRDCVAKSQQPENIKSSNLPPNKPYRSIIT